MATAINPISGPGIPLELTHLYTPLGIRFWDLTLNLPVAEGLTVTLRLMNSPVQPLTATLTYSGVYAFFGLPGLRAVEYPDDAGFGPPRTYSYVVTVQDQLGRYLPAVFVYTLDQTGAVLVGGVPDDTRGARMAYLFSAPTRTDFPGIALVSAYLIDQDAGTPAAWALVKINVGGDPETWVGITDSSGRVLVPVPYPVAQRLQLGSPPGSGQGSVGGETWPITVTVQYSPNKLGYPLANAPDIAWPWSITPNLKDILENQQAATIWGSPATPNSQFDATLTLGQDLTLRSSSGSPLSPSSSLNISRNASPL